LLTRTYRLNYQGYNYTKYKVLTRLHKVLTRFISFSGQHCPELSEIEHVSMVCDGENQPGAVCQFTCDVGYQLVGPPSLSCDNDGTWDEDPPVCRSK